MARTNRKDRRIGAFVLVASAFLAAAPPSGGQEPKGPPEKKEAAKPKDRVHSLSVIVADDSTRLPLAGATVVIHADDYDEQRLTASDGRVAFSFTTEANSVNVRVTATQMVPYNQPISLGAERDHSVMVLLKKRD